MTAAKLDPDAGIVDDQTDDGPENLYPDVYASVPDLLAEVYARPVSDQQTAFRWCSHWWAHAEAVARLEALWRAWETLRRDPGTGPLSWWGMRDATMAALTAPDGPFKRCSDTTHRLPPALPCHTPPAGL